MKSTPINQLPNNTTKSLSNKSPITETAGYAEDYANTTKAQENFKPPVDTSVNMNIDDDISINDVMSELNDNRTIELNETARLQEQINMLQNEIQNQKRQNETLMHQPVYVPQAPSARMVNQESLNNIESMKLRTDQTFSTPPEESSKDGMLSRLYTGLTFGKGSTGSGNNLLQFLDLKLFLVVICASMFVFSGVFDNFIGKYIKDSKYDVVKEPLKAVFLAIIVVSSLRV